MCLLPLAPYARLRPRFMPAATYPESKREPSRPDGRSVMHCHGHRGSSTSSSTDGIVPPLLGSAGAATTAPRGRRPRVAPRSTPGGDTPFPLEAG
jgi:hypothetical protein